MQFVKKDHLANLKLEANKLDIDELEKLSIDELKPVSTDLSKLSDIVKNDVVKKDVYHAKIKDIEDKIPDVTSLDTNATLNAKIN